MNVPRLVSKSDAKKTDQIDLLIRLALQYHVPHDGVLSRAQLINWMSRSIRKTGTPIRTKTKTDCETKLYVPCTAGGDKAYRFNDKQCVDGEMTPVFFYGLLNHITLLDLDTIRLCLDEFSSPFTGGLELMDNDSGLTADVLEIVSRKTEDDECTDNSISVLPGTNRKCVMALATNRSYILKVAVIKLQCLAADAQDPDSRFNCSLVWDYLMGQLGRCAIGTAYGDIINDMDSFTDKLLQFTVSTQQLTPIPVAMVSVTEAFSARINVCSAVQSSGPHKIVTRIMRMLISPECWEALYTIFRSGLTKCPQWQLTDRIRWEPTTLIGMNSYKLGLQGWKLPRETAILLARIMIFCGIEPNVDPLPQYLWANKVIDAYESATLYHEELACLSTGAGSHTVTNESADATSAAPDVTAQCNKLDHIPGPISEDTTATGVADVEPVRVITSSSSQGANQMRHQRTESPRPSARKSLLNASQGATGASLRGISSTLREKSSRASMPLPTNTGLRTAQKTATSTRPLEVARSSSLDHLMNRSLLAS